MGQEAPLTAVRSEHFTAQNTSYRSNVTGLVLRRTLRSSGSISANFSRLVSLAYGLLYTHLCSEMKRSSIGS
jgi:hypothetical protein